MDSEKHGEPATPERIGFGSPTRPRGRAGSKVTFPKETF